MRGVYAEAPSEISCLKDNFISLYLHAVQQSFEIKFPISLPPLIHCYTLNCDFTQYTRFKPWKCVFFSHCYWDGLAASWRISHYHLASYPNDLLLWGQKSTEFKLSDF